VQQQIVQIDPLGTVERAGGTGRIPGDGLLLRRVPVEGRLVVLVRGAVVRPTCAPDERRVDVADRVVLLRFARDASRWGSPAGSLVWGGRLDLPLKVGVDGSIRVLQFADRTAGHVLHD
jgi:hypothetical protein